MARTGLSALARDVALAAWYGDSPPKDFRREALWDEEGNAVVREALAADRPVLVGRLGSSELACASFYVRWRLGRGVRPAYPKSLQHAMGMNTGMFPTDGASLDRFAEVFLDAVSKTDVMGVSFNRNEHRIVRRFCPDARLVQLDALNPVLRQDPWSSLLSGRVVLVVHPFAKTIESQYLSRRALLFADPRILPEFELKTLVAVQSGAGGQCGHATWFEALDHMCGEIARIDFDVAIIGAGAYGLPLAAAVKDMGRQAVQLGGATQLLFGVRGRRWDVEYADVMGPLMNEFWVRPSAAETPRDAGSVEGGCYW